MTRPLVITCKTCGRPDVPDWGDGNCITCARDAVLEHPAHDNQGSQPPYAPTAAHDTPEQRLEAALDDELDMLPIADEIINLLKARILAAVTAELRSIVPKKAPESIIDIEGGDGNRDDCVEYGEDRGWNKAIDTMISKAKERGLL